jgi:nucleoside-diphosphate-sugar epimerase
MAPRVLVTGSGGFLGRRLTAALTARGVDVLVPDRRALDVTKPIEGNFDVEHVYHLAAEVGVPASWKNPARVLATNAGGTFNVLEYCRRAKASLTYISGYLYGIPRILPISESADIQPNNPYAFSKHLAEQTCLFYAREFGVTVTILRPFNIYGPGQSEDYVVGRIVAQVLAPDIPAIDVMDLTPRRDYVFVDDVVEAMLATRHLSGLHIFNVGSGESHTVGEVLQIIKRATSSTKPVTPQNVQRKNEIPDVVADISAIRTAVSWQPRTSLEAGLKKTIASSGGP